MTTQDFYNSAKNLGGYVACREVVIINGNRIGIGSGGVWLTMFPPKRAQIRKLATLNNLRFLSGIKEAK